MTERSLKEKTAKGLFWGGLSNGIQQLLNLLFGIILLRMLDATDYGMTGMLAIFTVIADSIQESGFTAALANKQVFRHEDYNVVSWFSFLMGASLHLLFFFCVPLIADFYKTPQLVPLSRFLFLGFLVSSCGTAHNTVLFKKLMVKGKAKATIIALFCSGTIGIVTTYNGMAFWGLVVQQITHISIANVLLWHLSQQRPTFSFNFRPIREMPPFSSKLPITNVSRYINDSIFSVLLGRLRTSQGVGYYTQANKWTNMGPSLASNMTSGASQPVLIETSSDAMRQKNISRKILRFTALVSFPSMFGLALIVNEFIIIVVTAKQQACVPIMQILCIWGASVPITCMYSNLLISKGKSNLFMWNTIVQSPVQPTILFCTISQGILVIVAIYTVINIGWLLIWHYPVNKQIHITLWEALKGVTPYLLISIAVIGASHFLTLGLHNLYMLLILKITIAVSPHVFITWIGKSVIFFEGAQSIRKKLQKQTTNIPIQQTKVFPYRANSSYWLYAQLTEWLTAHGAGSKSYLSYLELADSEFENGLLPPDYYPQFYTLRSIEAICKFIADEKISIILNYSHAITGDTHRYYLEIRKRNPGTKVFTMAHNCPSCTTQLKQCELSTLRSKDVRGAK